MPRQLENLKTDLSKNLIDEDKAAKYFLNESMAAEKVMIASPFDGARPLP